MRLSCNSSTLALVATLLTLAVDVQAAGAATRTLPRTVSTWADLADEDIRGFWKSIIVLEDGGVAVAKTLTEVTNSSPWAVSADYDKLARTDASGGGKWIRQFDGHVNAKWTGATGDGVTDDMTAIDAAITVAEALGTYVYLPSGDYSVSKSAVEHSAIRIVGDGFTSRIVMDEDGSADTEYLWPGDSLAWASFAHLSLENGFTFISIQKSLDQIIQEISLMDVQIVNSVYGVIRSEDASPPVDFPINSIVMRDIVATADLDVYAKAGSGVIWLTDIPCRKISLDGFLADNIASVLHVPESYLESGTIRNGIVENVAANATRGSVRSFNILGNYSVQNVRFLDSVGKDLAVSAGSIYAAGSGYSALEVVTVSGGTPDTAAQFTIATVGGSGEVTGLTLLTAGDYDGTIPANAVSVTGGSGTGLKILLEWAAGTYHAGVYDNYQSVSVRDCVFENWDVCDQHNTMSFKGSDPEGNTLIENVQFLETNGHGTGRMDLQGNNVQFRGCTWSGWTGEYAYSSGNRYVVSVNASGSPLYMLSLMDCLATNVTAEAFLRGTEGTSDSVWRIQNNRFHTLLAAGDPITITTDTGGVVDISNNSFTGTFNYAALLTGTALDQVVVANNSATGRLLNLNAANATLYVTGNDAAGDPPINLAGAVAHLVLGPNDFAADFNDSFVSGSGESVTNLEHESLTADYSLHIGIRAAAPTTGIPGTTYYNSTDGNVYIRANGGWVQISP